MVGATQEQKRCREEAAGLMRGEHLKIHAFAGAGKTTTLKMIAEVMPGRGCYLAFNRSIADEAKRKLATTRCTAASMHSIAFRAMRDMMNDPVPLNARLVRESGILDRMHVPYVPGWNAFRVGSAVCRTIAAFCNSDDPEIRPEHAISALVSATGDPEMLRNAAARDKARQAVEQLTHPVRDMAEAWSPWRAVAARALWAYYRVETEREGVA